MQVFRIFRIKKQSVWKFLHLQISQLFLTCDRQPKKLLADFMQNVLKYATQLDVFYAATHSAAGIISIYAIWQQNLHENFVKFRKTCIFLASILLCILSLKKKCFRIALHKPGRTHCVSWQSFSQAICMLCCY